MGIINQMVNKNLSVVVAPKHKFIYMKVHKVAGTSIFRHNLKPYFKDEVFEGKHTPDKMKYWYWNTTDEDLSNYFKFVFVRNPWDRAVSNYFYAKEIFNIKCSFGGFLAKLEERSLNPTILVHSEPMHDYFIHNDDLFVDYVGRFENLNNDWKYVAKIIGAKADLPKVNTTRHKNYKTYYNKTLIQKVYNIFQKEIDFLGYQF